MKNLEAILAAVAGAMFEAGAEAILHKLPSTKEEWTLLLTRMGAAGLLVAAAYLKKPKA